MSSDQKVRKLHSKKRNADITLYVPGAIFVSQKQTFSFLTALSLYLLNIEPFFLFLKQFEGVCPVIIQKTISQPYQCQGFQQIALIDATQVGNRPPPVIGKLLHPDEVKLK